MLLQAQRIQSTIALALLIILGNVPAEAFTMSSWKASCFKHEENITQYPTSAITFQELLTALHEHDLLTKTQVGPVAQWINPEQTPETEFEPFVQKLIVPVGSQVAMWGDLHGSIHSLLRSLETLKNTGHFDENFKIIKPDFYMLFLGDYVDRGKYGVEVMYTLLRLKLANPDHVFLVRGNHEDANINNMPEINAGGFTKELMVKFPTFASNYQDIYDLYERLPMAIFLGSGAKPINFVQCCHGGMEPGFNPDQLLACDGTIRYSWIGELARKSWLDALPSTLAQKLVSVLPADELYNFFPTNGPLGFLQPHIGFMWHDFIVDDSGTQIIRYTRGRGLAYGKPLVDHFLAQHTNQQYCIKGIYRAHQHNGTMLERLIANKGLVPLWNNTVNTLLSAPTCNLPYDSFIIVTTAPKYTDWGTQHVTQELS